MTSLLSELLAWLKPLRPACLPPHLAAVKLNVALLALHLATAHKPARNHD